MTCATKASSFSATSFKAVLWGGLLCGALDMGFALAYYGPSLGVMQAVAGGLLGQAAYQGGAPTAALGLVLHFVVALAWACLFWVVSRRIEFLVRYPLLAGMLYGLFIFYAMRMVVLPLSALRTPFEIPRFQLLPIIAHLLIVGPPISIAAKRFSERTKSDSR